MILTHQEIIDLTGYKSPKLQLEELQRQGFYRARISKTSGKIILEKESYQAVCMGDRLSRPKVRIPSLMKLGAA